MIKRDIADAVFEMGKNWGVTNRAAMEFVELTFDLIKNALSEGQEVKVPNFGVFRTKNKRARLGRNPQTGEKMTISGRRIVSFRWSKGLARKINKNPID